MSQERQDYLDNDMVKILVRAALVATAVVGPVGAAPQPKQGAPTAATSWSG